MATNEFFLPCPESRPTIYAYQDSNPQYAGQLKIGYTTRTPCGRCVKRRNVLLE
jgi:hypothetical protein